MDNANAVGILASIVRSSRESLSPGIMSAFARGAAGILERRSIDAVTMADLRRTADTLDTAPAKDVQDLYILWRAFMYRAIELLQPTCTAASTYDRMSFDEFADFLAALKSTGYSEQEMLSLLNLLSHRELDVSLPVPDGWHIVRLSDAADWRILEFLELCRMGALAQFN